jgi:hypothetical protein
VIRLEFQHTMPDLIHTPVPVRFEIGALDLLGFERDADPLLDRPWRMLMLPAFAVWGLASLRVAKKHGQASLDLEDYGDDLLFQMDGDDILVQTTSGSGIARVSYTSLLQAWETFARAVYDTIAIRHPDEYTQTWLMKIDDYPDPILEQWLLRADAVEDWNTDH